MKAKAKAVVRPGVSIGPAPSRTETPMGVLLVGGSPSWRRKERAFAKSKGLTVVMSPLPGKVKLGRGKPVGC